MFDKCRYIYTSKFLLSLLKMTVESGNKAFTAETQRGAEKGKDKG
jgi:hypothetical protein